MEPRVTPKTILNFIIIYQDTLTAFIYKIREKKTGST